MPLPALARRRADRRAHRQALAREHLHAARAAIADGAARALGTGAAALEEHAGPDGPVLLLRALRREGEAIEIRPRYATTALDAGGVCELELWQDDPGERAARLRSCVAALVEGRAVERIERYGRRGFVVTLEFPGDPAVVVREHELRRWKGGFGATRRPAW
jgi:hypothetical protein